MREPYPTEAQWLEYYTDLAAQCGGEIPISYPRITTWRCECGTDNATVEGERRRCTNKDCHILRLKWKHPAAARSKNATTPAAKGAVYGAHATTHV